MSQEEYSEEEYSEEEYSEEEHSNRLGATMAMLSETYPTIVYYQKAIACGLPNHFMDLRFPPDKWGRVPCKREAMDWYLENASIDEEAKTKAGLKWKKDLETAEASVKLMMERTGVQNGDGGIQSGTECDDSSNLK